MFTYLRPFIRYPVTQLPTVQHWLFIKMSLFIVVTGVSSPIMFPLGLSITRRCSLLFFHEEMHPVMNTYCFTDTLQQQWKSNYTTPPASLLIWTIPHSLSLPHLAFWKRGFFQLFFSAHTRRVTVMFYIHPCFVFVRIRTESFTQYSLFVTYG